MCSFFSNVGNWVRNSLAQIGDCISARGSKAQRLERKNARGGKLQIVIVPIPMDYSEFCRRIRAMEREDERKLADAKRREDEKNQIAKKTEMLTENIGIIPSAENEQATTMVGSFDYMTNDGYNDKPVESIAQVMLKLQQCYDEQEYAYNISVGISPRKSTYSAESGCLPPSEYYSS